MFRRILTFVLLTLSGLYMTVLDAATVHRFVGETYSHPSFQIGTFGRVKGIAHHDLSIIIDGRDITSHIHRSIFSFSGRIESPLGPRYIDIDNLTITYEDLNAPVVGFSGRMPMNELRGGSLVMSGRYHSFGNETSFLISSTQEVRTGATLLTGDFDQFPDKVYISWNGSGNTLWRSDVEFEPAVNLSTIELVTPGASGLVAVTAVPEPSSFVILAAMTCVCMVRKRRR